MDLKIKELLPQSVAIASAGTHLYRIGLSFYRFSTEKRMLFKRPVLLLSLSVYYIVKQSISVALPEQPGHFYVYIGDFTHFMGLRQQSGALSVILVILSMLSQILNYHNFVNGIKQPDLR